MPRPIALTKLAVLRFDAILYELEIRRHEDFGNLIDVSWIDSLFTAHRIDSTVIILDAIRCKQTTLFYDDAIVTTNCTLYIMYKPFYFIYMYCFEQVVLIS